MSKIVKLPQQYELWLTMSWSSANHGISGHVYEIIDYFHILKNHFTVGILISETLSWDTLEQAIRFKYTFTDDEINEIKSSTFFFNRPRVLQGRNILFVDGGVINTSSVMLYFDNIFYFACGNKEVKHNIQSNVHVLQDDRVYEPVTLNGINYKKRILFDKLKPIGESQDNILIYATTNCRAFNNYEQILQYDKHILVVTNDTTSVPTHPHITAVVPPIRDIFEQFLTYVYTPVQRKWDCSPRFIAECVFYGKEVIFHNIDYWDDDCGLKWRWWDINNDFDSLRLTSSDPIIDILYNIIQ